MLQARRGILKGLAAVVIGVATSLPALKKDSPQFAPPIWRTWNEYVLWTGNFSIYSPTRLKQITGFKDSYH